MNLVTPGPLIVQPQLSPMNYINISDHRYTVKIADTSDEIDEVMSLRFRIFNLELNEGFEFSYLLRRDEDRFDGQFHHLIVKEKKSGEIVGTYRIQTYEMAKEGIGFYSATEFEINRLGWLRLMRSVELGRACIAEEHRNGRVLFLLWKGIGKYMMYHQKRYLFGCCSLSSQETVAGTLLMNNFLKQGRVHKSLCINALPSFRCYIHAIKDVNIDLEGPPLMEIYFRYGAKVCSYPAIDREFKTIDYLVLMDLNEMNSETKELFR